MSAAEALRRGEIDAFWANGMGAEVAVLDGIGRILVDVRRDPGFDDARRYTFPVLATTERLVERDSDLARAVLGGVTDCQRILVNDPSSATAAAAKAFPPRETSLIAGLIERDSPYYDPAITQHDFEGVNAFARDLRAPRRLCRRVWRGRHLSIHLGDFMTTIVLDNVISGDRHVVEVGRVLIAGFTGRQREGVEEHIRELAEAGVPTPDRTPALYETDSQSVRQTSIVVVSAANTSGEVEPVVIRAGGQLLLTVGSDHTDRDLEREDIGLAKRACQKVIGRCCVPLDAISDWDRCRLMSWLDDDSRPYQSGTLAELMTLSDLLAELRAGYGLELRDGDVLFLGTLPALRRNPTGEQVPGLVVDSISCRTHPRVPDRGEFGARAQRGSKARA